MKNNTILTLLVGLIILISGCKTVETTSVIPNPPPSVQKVGPKLQALTQKYVSDLSKKDSAIFFSEVYFYNRTPIDLSLFIYDKSKPFSVVDGIAQKENTNVDILKTVPEMTSGKILDVRFDKTNPQIISALLLVFDANDRTYRLKFHRRITPNDGTFVLIPDAVVEYKSQEYKVKAETPVGSKDCILMFYGDEKANTIKVTETAKGFKIGASSVTEQPIPAKTSETEW